MLVRAGHRWSRSEVLDWLLTDMPPDTLVGFDMSTSLPYADVGAYFPGWADSPHEARSLWALVDAMCADDAHLGVSAFVNHAEAARYFRRTRARQSGVWGPGREGAAFGGGIGRLRVTELAQRRLGCRPTSNFNLVGAAQVGKASLAGMRLLHRLDKATTPHRIALWPIDPLPPHGSVLVEIYTTIAAIAAGRTAATAKMRNHAALNAALAALGSAPVEGEGPIADHASDALLAAAWLRTAAHRPGLWQPPEMTPQIARTEGWTFGAP